MTRTLHMGYPPGFTTPRAANPRYGTEWAVESTPERLPTSGLVYVTADWCGPCQTLAATWIASSSDIFTSPHAMLDITEMTPEQRHFMEQHTIRGAPALVFLETRAQGERPDRTPRVVQGAASVRAWFETQHAAKDVPSS